MSLYSEKLRIRNSEPKRNEFGFTLMETLVAMMLLASSLVVILQLFSGGLKSAKLADDYTRAVFHAREKMEEFLLKTQFEEGVYEGQFDDEYRWKVEIVLVVPEETEGPEVKPPPVDVFNLNVSVSWQSGDREKTFQVGTLQIAEKADETI
jgi:general secretion pathway protein I